MKFKLEYLAFAAVILLLLYAIWFVISYTEPISFADLATFAGAIISGAGIIFALIFDRINSSESRLSDRVNKVEAKLDDITKDLHYIKGKLNADK